MPRSKRLTRPSRGSPARSSRLRARAVTFTAPPPSAVVADREPVARRCGEAGGYVLDVGVVLGVEAVADERDAEGDGADEEADDGDPEGDAEVLGQGRDVAVGEARQGGGERDQRPHQAQRRSHANEYPGPLETAQRAVVVLGQALGDPRFGVGPADLLQDRRRGCPPSPGCGRSAAAPPAPRAPFRWRAGPGTRRPRSRAARCCARAAVAARPAAPPASTTTTTSAARASTSTGTRSASETSKRICSTFIPPPPVSVCIWIAATTRHRRPPTSPPVSVCRRYAVLTRHGRSSEEAPGLDQGAGPE